MEPYPQNYGKIQKQQGSSRPTKAGFIYFGSWYNNYNLQVNPKTGKIQVTLLRQGKMKCFLRLFLGLNSSIEMFSPRGDLAVLDLLLEHLAELHLLAHHPRLHELLLQAVLLGHPRVLHAAPEPPVELDVHRVW